MDTIRRRMHKSRNARIFWHIELTNESVKCKFIESGTADQRSRHIMQLKCSNNNKVITSCELFKESTTSRLALLQARGKK